MPFHPERYPADWGVISKRIRERDGNRCVNCGAVNHTCNRLTGKRVILTVSHRDHDTTHNTEDNLVSLCQRCHLAHDLELHMKHAAETRRKRKIEAGQGELFDVAQ